jgi:SAM-dependent methyltransferase
MASDAWDSGRAYEQYVGRWSRRVAAGFLDWIQPAAQLAWADIGCGTGALASTILASCNPRDVRGVDASEDFVAQARKLVADPRAHFDVGDAARLPWDSAAFDVVVSGLVLNFVPDQAAMVREMTRVTRHGGTVAVYVWDYADGMQMLRHFWDAAVAVRPGDAHLDEARRFPMCRPQPLRALFEAAGLVSIDVRAIEIPTAFGNFDEFWRPFLGRTGPAPAYLASLDEPEREKIRRQLASQLETSSTGAIDLVARAWAVKGMVA